MTARVPVTFEPAGVKMWVTPGTRVSEAAAASGIIIPMPCGGRGVCGRCAIRTLEGDLEPPDDAERAGLDSAPAGIRLGCRARIGAPVTIRPLVFGLGARGSAFERAAPDSAPVAAIDLGSTTVSVLLADAASGREIGRVSVPNRQVRFGADVVSRVTAALEGSYDELRHDAIASVIGALESACAAAGVTRENIARAVIAGNTVMMALLTGSEVAGFATAPFSAPDALRDPDAAADLAPLIAPRAALTIVPAVGSFVGGDLVAGLLAAGLACDVERTVYVDIGTNAEIASCAQGRLDVASTAAGPAFEGYGISHGGVAGPGAVTRMSLDGADVPMEVFGGGPAEWICGSGLISAIAVLRRVGHLDAAGRLWPSGPLADRFATFEGEVAFGLGAQGGPPYILQRDVRAVQTAKAAVIAGLLSLIQVLGEQAVTLVVSGSFGASLAPEDLVDLGVVPADAADVRVVEDGALLGAAAIALSPDLITEAVRLATRAHHVELASNETFTHLFVGGTRLERIGLSGT